MRHHLQSRTERKNTYVYSARSREPIGPVRTSQKRRIMHAKGASSSQLSLTTNNHRSPCHYFPGSCACSPRAPPAANRRSGVRPGSTARRAPRGRRRPTPGLTWRGPAGGGSRGTRGTHHHGRRVTLLSSRSTRSSGMITLPTKPNAVVHGGTHTVSK